MKTKKFNIWIAYSDLFTNLSTFLFIAALGVFASLGSMNLDKDHPQGLCSIPEEIEKRLADTKMLTPISLPIRVGSSCRRYYKIDGYQFHSPSALLGDFANSVQRMTEAEAHDRVCSPLWRTIGLQLFEDREGRVIFHGVGREDNGWGNIPLTCGEKLDEPAVDMLGLKSAKRASVKIEECYRGTYAGTICDDVTRCKSETGNGALLPKSDVCRQILTVRAWSSAEHSQCLRETAARHADRIWRTCKSPTWRFFPEDDLVRNEMSQIARFKETRPALWRRTAASGFAKDAPVTASLDDEAQQVLAKQPAGTVVIEVRMGAD